MNQRRGRAGAALLACLALTAAGCTASILPPKVRGTPPAGAHGRQPAQAVTNATLTAFNSCPGALAALRKAAQASITPYGLPNGTASSQDGVAFAASGDEKSAADSTAAGAGAPGSAPAAAAAPGAASGAAASGAAASTTPAFSGTNDYTAGVDEPDLVKTDGRRIVTVSGGTLEVIDAASRRVTGTLNLASYGIQSGSVNLLLSGDHALLLAPYAGVYGVASPAPEDEYGPRFFLVDLAGKPRVLASYTIDGNLVDARLVGSVVRIVTGSRPTIEYPAMPAGASNAERLAAYRAVTGRASLDAWLPGYESTDSSGDRIDGRVPCTAVSRPERYSGTNLLTVLTFDLSADAFGTGDPVSVVADGDTVYGTATSLYVASGGFAGPIAAQQDTKVYRFDITGPGAPRFAASGAVPGYLVNQYAMSEWNGYLRVATTTGTSWAVADGEPVGARTSSSAVYELTTSGPVMRIMGEVAGLGTTERIYAVRFMGPVGYVVTFRQTDPLYTLDLSDPSRPRVVGALGLTGYSAYLQPVSASRLVGIGQQADSVGHVLGTQVSLFDVSDLATPARLATYALASSMSAAETDPHAFLYWPADQLVVVPIQLSGPVIGDASTAATAIQGPESGALVLRINGGKITVAGFIRQPQTADYYGLPIERSLVIGQTLWTVSTAGLLASDLASLRQQAWLPFSQTGISYPERSGVSASLP